MVQKSYTVSTLVAHSNKKKLSKGTPFFTYFPKKC